MFHEGKQIGPYKLIRRLGRGGFGEVWLGHRHGKFATTEVALKLPLDEQVDHAAIAQEAQLWAKASGHPNVLPIIEADEYDGQIVIVSEYAPDGSLDEYLKQNVKMPIEKAVETTIQILDGLEFLHSRRIIHRDLKPANILFQGNTPRLADFGISRAITDSSLSMTVAGTSDYMAIEAFGGKRNAQTDIFALGVILYLLLTGKQPFLFRREIMKAILIDNETLLRKYKDEAPQSLSSEIPAELQKIVFKSLAQSPDYRYKTAAKMREELRQFLRQNRQPVAPEIPPTQSFPIYSKPTADNPVSEVTNIKTPPQTNEVETTVRPASTSTRSKTKRIYLAVPTITLLLFVILGVYWFTNSVNDDKQSAAINNSTNNNTKQFPTASPSKSETADPVLYSFRKGDKFGFRDSANSIIIPPKYDGVNPFSEDLAPVKLNDKWGFIDKTGKEIIPLKYDSAYPFSEGLAGVNLNDKWGFIDKTGKEIIPLKYDFAYSFSEGLGSVVLNGKSLKIDKNGKEYDVP